MKTQIQERKVRLNKTKETLKRQFFGIDKQIDDIVDSISAWYLAPEIITRPVIVNLWGLTGVGKTSVVRSLVHNLGFSPKFMEIQMGDNTIKGGTMYHLLNQSNIAHKEVGVILLDEFQRFRTVDSDGSEIQEKKLDDVWMLLSDGKFTFDLVYKQFMTMLSTLNYQTSLMEFARANKNKKVGKDAKEEALGLRSWVIEEYEAKSIKKYLGLSESIAEIRHLPLDQIAYMLEDFMVNNTEPFVDYTKCLIFVSGNLDEAFSVADEVDNCDADADIFHEYTKKVTVAKVKSALTARFKPEQIARLGNDHIIYPSLSKDTYKKLIHHNCYEYINKTQELSGIKFKVAPELFDAIYENSVYPAQGTRPVFSTIQKIFTSPLTRGVVWCYENDFSTCAVTIDRESSDLTFSNGKKKFVVHINLDVDTMKRGYSDDLSALIAVHEAGHAIVFSDLLHQSPTEIKINTASFNGGYNILDTKFLHKDSLLKTIAVTLGGIAAEEVVFGSSMRSTGCESDLAKATRLASQYVRRYAMNGSIALVTKDPNTTYVQDTKDSDIHIESILKEQQLVANAVIEKHKDLLITMSKHILDLKHITKEQFDSDYSHHFEFKESSEDTYGNYHEILMSK